ncbi:MAG: aromatic ring-hydroxylating dioxygenase subunit alpha [Pusillimonas sp.]
MTKEILVRDAWYIAGLSGDFQPDELHGQVIVGRPVLIWRTASGRVAAFDDRCCHKRVPLSAGRVIEGRLLECAYHGLCFDSTGGCVRIPSQPEGKIPEQARLKPLPVVEQDGLVWVWPGNPGRAAGFKPPSLPEVDDESWGRVLSEPLRVPANSMLMIENLLDITHFYPLHEGNIGDIENSKIPVELEEGEAGGAPYVKTIRTVRDYKLPPDYQRMFGYDVVDRVHTHAMLGPGVSRVELWVWPAGKLGDTASRRGYVAVHAHTPIDEKNHIYRWMINMPIGQPSGASGQDDPLEIVKNTFPTVINQDLWILEKQQRMFGFPDDGFSEVFLRSDLALRRARQILTKMQKAETESS